MCRIFYKYLPQLRKEQCWSGTLQKHCTFLFHLAPQLFQAPDGLLKLFLTPQFSSVAQSCPTLCDPMDCSTPGFPVHHQPPEFTQTHVLWVGDAIQPSHPLVPFSSHLQPFPGSGSFQMSQFFASGGQSNIKIGERKKIHAF